MSERQDEGQDTEEARGYRRPSRPSEQIVQAFTDAAPLVDGPTQEKAGTSKNQLPELDPTKKDYWGRR